MEHEPSEKEKTLKIAFKKNKENVKKLDIGLKCINKIEESSNDVNFNLEIESMMIKVE